MPRESFTNAAATTLDGAINSSTTVVTLTDASSFPAAYFRIIVESEIMFCTSRSSDVLTVIRAQEGTTGASHADLIACAHVLTAGALAAIRNDFLAAGGVVDATPSLSTDDDDFDDESFSGSWTTVQSTPNCTVIEKSHRASIRVPTGTATAQHFAFLKAKVPSTGDYVQAGFLILGNANQFPMPMVMITDGVIYGSGKQMCFAFSTQETKFFLRKTTGFNSNPGGGDQIDYNGQTPFFAGTLHLRIVWVSSNHYTVMASPDAISWMVLDTNVNIGDLGTPTHMGFAVTSWGSNKDSIFSASYCRFSF